MPAIQLSVAERKAHRAEAHHLDPVVMIGNEGLTAAVKKETDAALNAHGLIKVRVLGDDREAREAMFQQLCDALGAVLVLRMALPPLSVVKVDVGRRLKALSLADSDAVRTGQVDVAPLIEPNVTRFLRTGAWSRQ